MNRIILLILLFVSLSVNAQKIPVSDTIARNAITEQGKPIGGVKLTEVNKDGDSLISADGNLELIIPPGALSKKTNISIQPVKNMFPNGNGLAYHLEPSGMEFQKPIQIIFHYDPEESQDSAQLLMGIAMQDDKGQWYGLKKFTMDTVAKTISGYITHFSTWATFDKLKLVNLLHKERIKVNEMLPWGIYGVDWTPEHEEREEEKDKNVLQLRISWKQPTGVIWRANNIIWGNAEFGTLKKGLVSESNAKYNEYTAPANVPDWNPVTISAELEEAFFKINGKIIKDLTLRSKILIYDNAYEVTMITGSMANAGFEFGVVRFRDTGSFVISLNGKNSKIIEKKNKNVTAELGYEGGRCKITLLKSGYGDIHIIGQPSITITPETATTPAKVDIKFAYTPVMLPVLKYSCPNRKGGATVGTTVQATGFARMIQAFPQVIRFDAIEGERILLEFGKEDSEFFYRCTVRKLKDD